MHIKGVEAERFQDYRYPSMLVAFPRCSFKCETECGKRVCQNSTLATAPTIEVSAEEIVRRYLSNPITKAIVCGGLEPMDSFEDVLELISTLRSNGCHDDVVVYTGYYKCEIAEKINALAALGNVVMKYGRFVPDKLPHLDNILGVELANDEQYGERIC